MMLLIPFLTYKLRKWTPGLVSKSVLEVSEQGSFSAGMGMASFELITDFTGPSPSLPSKSLYVLVCFRVWENMEISS